MLCKCVGLGESNCISKGSDPICKRIRNAHLFSFVYYIQDLIIRVLEARQRVKWKVCRLCERIEVCISNITNVYQSHGAIMNTHVLKYSLSSNIYCVKLY